MTLKAFVSSLEDVPEELRSYYRQQDDGRYKFGAEDVEDVTHLKTALERQKAEGQKARATLQELRESTDGIDFDLARQLLEEHEKGQRKKAIDEDRVEELITTEVEKRIAKMRDKHGEDLRTLTEERDLLRGRLEKVLIDNSLSSEATKAGILADALPDVIRRGRERFSLHDDKVVARDGEGNILYGPDGQTSQSVTEFMEELKASARHLFAPSQGGGASRQFNSGRGDAVAQGQANLRGLSRMRAAREQRA